MFALMKGEMVRVKIPLSKQVAINYGESCFSIRVIE